MYQLLRENNRIFYPPRLNSFWSRRLVIQIATFFNPLRYFLVIIRGIFLKGIGIKFLWPYMAVLLVMGLSIIFLSSQRFKKSLG